MLRNKRNSLKFKFKSFRPSIMNRSITSYLNLSFSLRPILKPIACYSNIYLFRQYIYARYFFIMTYCLLLRSTQRPERCLQFSRELIFLNEVIFDYDLPRNKLKSAHLYFFSLFHLQVQIHSNIYITSSLSFNELKFT